MFLVSGLVSGGGGEFCSGLLKVNRRIRDATQGIFLAKLTLVEVVVVVVVVFDEEEEDR